MEEVVFNEYTNERSWPDGNIQGQKFYRKNLLKKSAKYRGNVFYEQKK